MSIGFAVRVKPKKRMDRIFVGIDPLLKRCGICALGAMAAFSVASCCGHHDLIGANSGSRTQERDMAMSPIAQAAAQGDTARVKRLLDEGDKLSDQTFGAK